MKLAVRTLIAVLSLLPCLGPAQQAPRPSVILITVDTLRADRISPYGYTNGKTPNMQEFSQESALFENTFVQTPITLPSHASILTGTYPMYHKLQDVVGRLRDGVPTLASVLKTAGYSTGAAVGSTVLSSQWKLNPGFDMYDDHFNISEGLRQVDFDRVERSADDVLAPAVAWLQATTRRPLFLWIHFYDPHDPYTPPPPFSTEFKSRPYDGEIAYVDATLGKLFNSLKKLGLYDNSLIVLTSDHGESLGEHQELHHAYYIYDASLKVPLMIRFPGARFKGTRLPNNVRSVDIAPTILQFLKIAIPTSMQGESLLAMAAGKRPNVDLPVYAETYYPKVHFGWSPLFGYVVGHSKFIEAPQREYYDLGTDRGEITNTYSTNQALAQRLRTELFAFQQKYTFKGQQAEKSFQADPDTVARLKSLGYVALSAPAARSESGLPDPKVKIQVYNRLNRGIALSRGGAPRKAIDLFNEVAAQEPTMPIVHFLLGMEYFDHQWYLKAMEEFKETLKYNPDSDAAMFNLARSYLESGQTDQAVLGFKHLLELDPGHFAARHYLSLCYARRTRYAEAIEEETKALSIRPDYVEGYNNLGSYCLNLELTDRAIEAYQKAISLQPDMLLARTNLTLAFIRKGAWDEAIREAKEVLRRDSQRSLAHYYLGQAYLAKGMKQDAREAFQKAKELDPKLNVPAIL